MTELPKLPSLKELEKITPTRPKMLEITCPILERQLLKDKEPGPATIHIIENEVVCEHYRKEHRHYKDMISYRCCLLSFDIDNYKFVGYGACPYSRISE